MNSPDTSISPPKQSPRRGIAVWLAAAGGVGFIRKAPGTWGSLLGIPVAMAYQQIHNLPVQVGILFMLALVGVPICALAHRCMGGPHDPGWIVYDEVVGMAVTLFMFDATRPLTAVLAFGLFRLFDILKPTPARELERLNHGWGIMADDLAAAVYANLSLCLLAWFRGVYLTGLPPI